MENASLNYLISRTIYSLKQRYGNEISVYRLATSSTNYETGVKTTAVTSYDIRKAVVMPASDARRFFNSVNQISSMKQYLAPGNPGWDESNRAFIIAGEDLPNFEFEPEDWIVHKHARYDIVTITKLEDRGWLILAKELKGTDAKEVININANSSLDLGDEADGS